jgi:folate-binding protein YgfZ
MGQVIGAWSDRDVVRASGADAGTFLQGQLSQDVLALAVGASAWSLLLQPAGKLTAWVRVTREADESFLIDVEPGWGETVVARLARFRIRVAVDLEELDGFRMFSVRGGETPVDDIAAGTIVAPAPGAAVGVVGYDLVGRDVAEPDGVVIDPDATEQYRIAHAVPAMGAELDDSVIPAEIGAWFVDESVSWTKGCYTGQELVARVDSRGSNTPRRLRSVELAGPASAGDEVLLDGAVVGALTSVFGDRALARIGRAVEPPAAVTIKGVAATVTG